jgi:hypothetical protein
MKGFDIMFSSEIKKEIAFEMYDSFKNYESIQDMYLCDIASEFYNNDYYIIGTYQAKEWLKKYFDDMLEVIEYWEDMTGEQYGHMITEVEKLATLVAYTVADTILNEVCEYLGYDNDEICTEMMEMEIIETLYENYL